MESRRVQTFLGKEPDIVAQLILVPRGTLGQSEIVFDEF